MKIYWRRQSMEKLVSKLSTKKHYISLDWGISLPAAFLSNGRYDIKDLQPFYAPKCQEIKPLKDTVYILHNINQEVFTAYRKQCKIQLQKLNIENINDFTLYSSNI